jgi:hypothetical protein
LHANPARRETVGTAVLMQPLDEAPGRPIPALGRPQRQRMVDHEGYQDTDDNTG